MILDRARLAQYVGSDPEFEAQYLTLLRETVRSCQLALNTSKQDLYRSLHAAKPGLMVATQEAFSTLLTQVCDELLVSTDEAFSDQQTLLLEKMRVDFIELATDIQVVLSQR
jgi:hypothetical protein